jgi:glycosyltransferase involved in cell wall biosynthesis
MTAALRDLQGIEVEIATTDADGQRGRLRPVDLPKDAVTVHLFRRHLSERLTYSRGLTDWLGNHARDYDVIQVHMNWNHPIFAVRRAARNSGVPYIIRPCETLNDYTFRKSKWVKRVYWWLRERSNIRYAAGFHVNSDGERDAVLRLGVTAPVEVIALGIGNDAFETPVEPNWLREHCPQAGNRPILLFLSRLDPKKGITDFLLPALARMQTDPFLAIVGGEDAHNPGYVRRVESEIARLGLGQKVALLGPVPPQRRWAAFDGADLFVLPSLDENFSFVAAEAMARGKPVVVTRGVEFGTHVAASEAGAVVRADADDLAECLDLWLSDPARRSLAGKSGRQYIRDHFTWQQTAERLMGLYRQIIRSRRAI